jgi:hypothetical protein
MFFLGGMKKLRKLTDDLRIMLFRGVCRPVTNAQSKTSFGACGLENGRSSRTLAIQPCPYGPWPMMRLPPEKTEIHESNI